MNPAVDAVTDYARPRDPVELWLARSWQDVLGFTVGVTENFFGVGGNSLDAARIINLVLAEFDLRLPLNAVTENPTVASLAALIRPQVGPCLSGPLVDIQGGDGSCPPLFLVHPASGQVGLYSALAHALGDEFAVFGLQPAGLYDGGEPSRSVPEMARAYLDAIRAVEPAGPYCLGGCTTGAPVAVELARQLLEAGAEVRLLAAIDLELVDPALAAWRPRERAGDVPGTLFDMLITPNCAQPWFRELSRSRQLAWVLADWKANGLAHPAETTGFVARAAEVWRASEEAARAHRPEPYPGPLRHFRASECDGIRQLADAIRESIKAC